MAWVENGRLRQFLNKNGATSVYRLGNASISPHLADVGKNADGDLIRVDVLVERGCIKQVCRTSAKEKYDMDVKDIPCIDLAGRLIMPTFVDCHTHLDKGHIIQRTPDADGSFATAIAAIDADREKYWCADDLRVRMDFALRCAYHHGTKALRTHLDTQANVQDVAWLVFSELRQEWQGRLTLQAACLTDIETARDRQALEAMARLVARHGGVLGAFVYMSDDIDMLLARMFAVADSYGLALDFHADETLDPSSQLLLKIAETCLASTYGGHVLVGHCCALSQQVLTLVDKTLDKVAHAGLNVVSLPMCNLYLQDRRHDGTTPRQRGVTLLHEMKARGIMVALGSDNTRDPFYAYGDLDMLEVYRLGTRILHLDHGLDDWPCSVGKTPAAMMGMGESAGDATVTAGQSADFIIFEGRTWGELLSRPEHDRLVIRGGQLVETTLPSYSELDELRSMAS